ncbi:MAG: hypothetical protein OXN27_25780 [Candidatus Poribacteria bacterium]|nr:hypothetical protein [Candidatus Poribacteria bacterium]
MLSDSLNFYLSKTRQRKADRTSKEHRVTEANLANVRSMLHTRGIRNAARLDYTDAIFLLAKLVADEIRDNR